LAPADGSAPPEPESLRLPDTVRQVIARRLGRLPDATTELLRVAAAFTGGIDFEVARRGAGVEEGGGLDALDAALSAQLLKPANAVGTAYDFAHALVRHTLYEAQSPARQVRLHRQIAERMEAVYGDRGVEHAAEIAQHWHRSAALPGAERGVTFCLAAAEQAERRAGFAESAAHLRAALKLLPENAAEHVRLHARLGLALVWALRFDDAAATAHDAATRIASTEGFRQAADYLAEVVMALDETGAESYTGSLARQGLEYAGERRDVAWATLKAADIVGHGMNDPVTPGIPLDTPERRQLAAIFGQAPV